MAKPISHLGQQENQSPQICRLILKRLDCRVRKHPLSPLYVEEDEAFDADLAEFLASLDQAAIGPNKSEISSIVTPAVSEDNLKSEIIEQILPDDDQKPEVIGTEAPEDDLKPVVIEQDTPEDDQNPEAIGQATLDQPLEQDDAGQSELLTEPPGSELPSEPLDKDLIPQEAAWLDEISSDGDRISKDVPSTGESPIRR